MLSETLESSKTLASIGFGRGDAAALMVVAIALFVISPAASRTTSGLYKQLGIGVSSDTMGGLVIITRVVAVGLFAFAAIMLIVG